MWIGLKLGDACLKSLPKVKESLQAGLLPCCQNLDHCASLSSLSQDPGVRELCRKLCQKLNRNWAVSTKFTTKFAIKFPWKAAAGTDSISHQTTRHKSSTSK